jgi:dUTP pyrophosphatase
MISLRLLRLDPGLPMPRYAHGTDAGLDLFAAVGAVLPASGGRAVVGTGVAVEIPAGYAGLICPRSGLAAEHGVTVLNAPGVVDSGYRGEILVILTNTDASRPHRLQRGDRIAQLLLVAIEKVTLDVVSELSRSERGHRRLGDSGR